MTILSSNMGDHDCSLFHYLWDGLEYASVIDTTVENPIPWEIIVEAVTSEDETLVLMGHGCPYGLFSPNYSYYRSTYLFNEGFLPYVRAKNIVGIWCHASDFAEMYSVKGFFTSMFVSNPGEAIGCGLGELSRDCITESNIKFYQTMNRLLKENIPMSEWKAIIDELKNDGSILEEFNYGRIRIVTD